MTITAKIDGIGTATFPDGTPQEVIQEAVKKLVAERKTKQQERYAGPLGQFKKIADIATQEAEAGAKAVSKAVEDPTGGNILQGIVGALQWGASPLTAIGRGVFRDPVEIVSRGLGAPEGVTQFLGEMAESADILLPYGGLVKGAMATKKATESALAAEKAMKSIKLADDVKKIIKGHGKLQMPEGVPKGLVEEVQQRIAGGTKKTVLAEEFVDDLVDAVKDKVGPKWNPSQRRITQETANYIMSEPEEIQKFLKRYPDYSPERLAAELIETMSTSGRELSIMGRWAKQLKKSFKSPDMQKIAEYMEKEIPKEVTTMDKFWSRAKGVESARRGMLVSQMATAMRNAISQAGRVTIGTVDDAFQGAIREFMGSAGEGTVKSILSPLRGMGEGFDSLAATVSRFSPTDRRFLENILNQDQALKAKAILRGTSVHEVTIGNKIGRIANTLNTAQEHLFRNMAFQARLNVNLKRAGIKGGIKGIDPKDIPEEVLIDAAKYGLEMTFAASPKSKFGQEFVKSMSNPIFTALLNPFPRFLWGNAMPYLKEFSPIGFLDALSPKVVADLASGDASKFAKAASRASIGTIMLNTASYIRNSNMAGEKWYEIKVGDKQWDTRPFAPLTSYLFIAEAMQNPEKIKPADIGQALLSLNRVAGTGLVLTDIIRGKTAQTVMTPLKRLAGEYIGSFTTTARTFKDFYSAIDPEEAIIRDIRGDELLGPTIRNIPEISQRLPEAKSPLKIEPMKTEAPVLRQLSGLSYRVKNAIEMELDDIALDKTVLYPKTGLPEADRKIAEIMAPTVGKISEKVLASKQYQQLDDQTKRVIWWGIFTEIKSDARKQLTSTDPKLASQIKVEGIPTMINELLKSKGINLKKIIEEGVK